MKTINRDTILTPTPLVCDFAIIQEHNQINLRSVYPKNFCAFVLEQNNKQVLKDLHVIVIY